MILIRDVFRCKPGKAKELVAKFKKTFPAVKKEVGVKSIRIMTDLVTNYWTVVLEMEAESMGDFEARRVKFGQSPTIAKAMEGYMDLVEGGHREIYKIE